MTTPRTDYLRPLAGVLMELLGALTALRMEPDHVELEDDGHLYEEDRRAAHAIEHLEAALTQLRRVQRAQAQEVLEAYGVRGE